MVVDVFGVSAAVTDAVLRASRCQILTALHVLMILQQPLPGRQLELQLGWTAGRRYPCGTPVGGSGIAACVHCPRFHLFVYARVCVCVCMMTGATIDRQVAPPYSHTMHSPAAGWLTQTGLCPSNTPCSDHLTDAAKHWLYVIVD